MKWLYIDDNRSDAVAANKVFYNIARLFPDDTMVSKQIISYSDEYSIAEQIMTAVDRLCEAACREEADYIIVCCSSCRTEYAGRLAKRLNMDCVTNVEEIRYSEGELTVSMPVYNGNLIYKKDISGQKTVIAIQPSAFESLDEKEGNDSFDMPDRTQIIRVGLPENSQSMLFDVIPFEEEENNIKDADIVLVMGHGFREEEQVNEAKIFAQKTGIALGGSRPVVIDGLLPVSKLVGMSGNSIHAKKCLLMGVSGASAFLEGIKYCDHVISVNTDQDAAVFKASHQGIIGDCHNILHAMNKILEEQNGFK